MSKSINKKVLSKAFMIVASLGLILMCAITFSACGKEDPKYTVPEGLRATYGQTLADITLPEGFTWEDALTTSVGNVGENTFKVTFTPENTDDYNTIKGIEVVITVDQATLSAPTGLTAVYGQTLADVDLPENFVWVEALTTPVGNVGTAVHNAKYTANDAANYSNANAVAVSIEVTAAQNALQGEVSIEGWTYNEQANAPTGLTAKVGEVVYEYSDEIDGVYTTTVPTNAGTYYVRGAVRNLTGYQDVVSQAVEFTIAKADPQFTQPGKITAVYGQTLADVELPEGFSFVMPLDTPVGNVGATNVFSLNYTPEDTDNYNILNNIAAVTIEVEKAYPSVDIPQNVTARYWQTLDSISLPEGFSWIEPSTVVGSTEDYGTKSFEALYTPEDTNNYHSITVRISINVIVVDDVYKTSGSISFNGEAGFTNTDDFAITKLANGTYLVSGTPSTMTAAQAAAWGDVNEGAEYAVVSIKTPVGSYVRTGWVATSSATFDDEGMYYDVKDRAYNGKEGNKEYVLGLSDGTNPLHEYYEYWRAEVYADADHQELIATYIVNFSPIYTSDYDAVFATKKAVSFAGLKSWTNEEDFTLVQDADNENLYTAQGTLSTMTAEEGTAWGNIAENSKYAIVSIKMAVGSTIKCGWVNSATAEFDGSSSEVKEGSYNGTEGLKDYVLGVSNGDTELHPENQFWRIEVTYEGETTVYVVDFSAFYTQA